MSTQQERPWPAIDIAELRYGLAFDLSHKEMLTSCTATSRGPAKTHSRGTESYERAVEALRNASNREAWPVYSPSVTLSPIARARRRVGSRSPFLAALRMRSANKERVTLVWPAGKRDHASSSTPFSIAIVSGSKNACRASMRELPLPATCALLATMK
jgi:hypothetical protein